MDVLSEPGWIDVPPGPFRQALRYEITDWKRDQDPSNAGYFKLFRNLRDASRADLLGDPLMFRVWLYLLAEARSFPDENLEVDAGEALIKPRHAMEKTKLDENAIYAEIAKLEARGSVERGGVDGSKLTIVNWNLYQTRLYPSNGGNEADSQ